MSRDIHVLFQAVDLPGTDFVVFDQTILADVFSAHSFPQTVIFDHINHPCISLNPVRGHLYIIHNWTMKNGRYMGHE